MPALTPAPEVFAKPIPVNPVITLPAGSFNVAVRVTNSPLRTVFALVVSEDSEDDIVVPAVTAKLAVVFSW